MVVIKVCGDQKLGRDICEALVGNRAYIENDIIVNYDDPKEIIIVLGESNGRDVTLEMTPRKASK